MADKQFFDFSQFVPGFDFLKGLIPGAGAGGAAPSSGLFSNWLAPTLDAQEVQRRIDELRIVQFWLEQNGRALSATIQALEVQKLTLETLRSINTGAHQVAQAIHEGVAAASSAAASTREAAGGAGAFAADAASGQNEEAGVERAANDLHLAQAQALQWWSALSEQFQKIASHALDDLAQNFAVASASIPDLAPAAQAPDQPAPADQAEAGAQPSAARGGKAADKPVAARKTRTAKADQPIAGQSTAAAQATGKNGAVKKAARKTAD